MVPGFTSEGVLPAGVHEATWTEIEQALGFTVRRRWLLEGLKLALTALHSAGCLRVYIDGSFATSKPDPGDFDGCWEEANVDAARLDPVLLDFSGKREKQKLKFRGEMFPASALASPRGSLFLAFFQKDKNGDPKGIIAIKLDRWQP